MNSSQFTGEIKTNPEADLVRIRFRQSAGELSGQEESSIY